MLKSMSKANTAYVSNQAYILDLLHLLDLSMLRIFAGEEEKSQGENPWKGLVISPDEIHRLLFEEASYDKTPDGLRLDKLIQQKWDQIREKERASSEKLEVVRCIEQFSLDHIGVFMMILGMANTLHSKYERIFGYLNDNVVKKHPTFDILVKALELNNDEKLNFKRKLLEPWGPYRLLLKWDDNDNSPFFSKEIKLHDRIVQFLMGETKGGVKDYPFYRVIPYAETCLPMLIHQKSYESIVNSYMGCMDGLFLITGDNGVGKKHALQNMSNRVQRNMVILDASSLMSDEITFTELLRSVRIEIKLNPSLVVVDHIERFFRDPHNNAIALNHWISEFALSDDSLFMISHTDINITKVSDEPVLKFKLERPTYDERHRLWTYYMNQSKLKDLSIDDLSEKFRFTPLQIKNAVSQYALSVNNNVEVSIYEVAKEQIHHKLDEKATWVRPVFGWDQLVLPKEQSFILKSVCSHVEKKHLVYSQWGFEKTIPYGSGTAVVFSGPPGTGKTMAAQVLSKALKLDLYKIDLSQLVSKYIGETEKNLHKIFHEASISNAILFFDEADALFGKRSEVKEAKDRFANIEVSYLLQKIEEYDGVTILATNYITNIDKAFLRRIRFIVDFPFPDVEAREKIWKLSIPEQVPLASDVDFEYLARTFELSGGNIKNVIVNSAFFAADSGQKLSMKEMIKSAGYELQKMDKLLLKSDLKEFGYLMD